MKAFLSLVTVLAFTFAFGLAFADDVPTWESRNIGIELYKEAFVKPTMDIATLCVKDFSSGLPVVAGYDETVTIDTGRALYNEAFLKHEPMMEEKGMKGAAAGGICPEEVIAYVHARDKIWDELFGSSGRLTSLQEPEHLR